MPQTRAGHGTVDSRLLRLVLPLDAVASGAMIVVVLATVPALVVWGTSAVMWVIGLLLIGYAVALAVMGAIMAAVLAAAAARGSDEFPPQLWLVLRGHSNDSAGEHVSLHL